MKTQRIATLIGQGLASLQSSKFQGFLIPGADKNSLELIPISTATLSSSPAAVRFAWSGNAVWANLFNKDVRPSQTFHTDDWETEFRASRK